MVQLLCSVYFIMCHPSRLPDKLGKLKLCGYRRQTPLCKTSELMGLRAILAHGCEAGARLKINY